MATLNRTKEWLRNLFGIPPADECSLSEFIDADDGLPESGMFIEVISWGGECSMGRLINGRRTISGRWSPEEDCNLQVLKGAYQNVPIDYWRPLSEKEIQVFKAGAHWDYEPPEPVIIDRAHAAIILANRK